MISYYAKVHLSKWNGSWVVSIKQTMNFNIQTAAMFVFFCFWQKCSYWKLFILWRSISIQNFMVPRWMVQVLHPPQKFERPPFWNGWNYGINKYGIEVTFNGMTSLLNLIKIYKLVQKLWRETHRQTDRQTGDPISLTFLLEESRLKNDFVRRSLLFNFLNENITKQLHDDIWKCSYFKLITNNNAGNLFYSLLLWLQG
jgi:hypothetical protein